VPILQGLPRFVQSGSGFCSEFAPYNGPAAASQPAFLLACLGHDTCGWHVPKAFALGFSRIYGTWSADLSSDGLSVSVARRPAWPSVACGRDGRYSSTFFLPRCRATSFRISRVFRARRLSDYLLATPTFRYDGLEDQQCAELYVDMRHDRVLVPAALLTTPARLGSFVQRNGRNRIYVAPPASPSPSDSQLVEAV